MNKKLIALAVAAAIAPAAAMADSGNVTIYGVAHASYDNINTNAPGQDTLHRISSNSSRLGFKGTEDLGNGLSAIWQVESSIGLDATSGSTLGGRNTFVGLSSKTAGTALLGRHDTPYKLATGGLDVFADTMGDYNAIIGNVNGSVIRDLRLDNVAAYISPTFNGFHAAVATSLLNETGNPGVSATTGNANPSAWSLAGIYDNGPLFASLAYETQKTAVVNTESDSYNTKGTKLGLGYKFGQGTQVGLVYERLTDSRANSALTRNAYVLNVAHTMGANVIKASYGHANDGASADDTAATNWTIGVDHNFSKRTALYALYTKTDNASGATYGVGNGGAGGYYNAAVAGQDPRAVSIGMKHSF